MYRRRRVSSAALREASPVFDALIGRRLQQEGTNPSVPIALALPVHKNGSHAMELICNALHKRPEALPQSLDRQLLKSVWSLCDKYKITRRLMQVMMFSWLGNAIKSLDNVSNDTVLLVELLGGSLYFGLTEHISRLGLLLVKTTTGSLMLHSPRLPRAVSDPLGETCAPSSSVKVS